MFYEICFVRGDLPLGIARDIFLKNTDDLLVNDPRLTGRLTAYSVACDIRDNTQIKSFVQRAKSALNMTGCHEGSLISENPVSEMEKRNVRVGLVYYASATFEDTLGGSGWCVARPCRESQAKAAKLKILK